MPQAPARVGVYVDAENLARNGGYGMRYDVLREFAARGNAEPVRLNVYVAYDFQRAEHDSEYRDRVSRFHSTLRDFGYKVILKEVRWFVDENGQAYAKANADLDMAVDALLQSERLDRVLLGTGDGDFVQVVRALQNRGCRVEVVAFENVAADLKREADLFISGYLIPNLLPVEGSDRPWGELGSRVRGVCYSFKHEDHYGFLRFMERIAPNIWNIDTRHPESPYRSVFAHESQFKDDIDFSLLPSRDHIFEFTLVETPKGLQAYDIKLISGPGVRHHQVAWR